VRAKGELIRIVRSPVHGTFIVDPYGKEKGRGTYVCPNADCVNRAMQTQLMNRAFRVIPNSVDRINLETVNKLKQDLLELIKVEHH